MSPFLPFLLSILWILSLSDSLCDIYLTHRVTARAPSLSHETPPEGAPHPPAISTQPYYVSSIDICMTNCTVQREAVDCGEVRVRVRGVHVGRSTEMSLLQCYGVNTVSRLLEIIGLFRRLAPVL